MDKQLFDINMLDIKRQSINSGNCDKCQNSDICFNGIECNFIPIVKHEVKISYDERVCNEHK